MLRDFLAPADSRPRLRPMARVTTPRELAEYEFHLKKNYVGHQVTYSMAALYALLSTPTDRYNRAHHSSRTCSTLVSDPKRVPLDLKRLKRRSTLCQQLREGTNLRASDSPLMALILTVFIQRPCADPVYLLTINLFKSTAFSKHTSLERKPNGAFTVWSKAIYKGLETPRFPRIGKLALCLTCKVPLKGNMDLSH